MDLGPNRALEPAIKSAEANSSRNFVPNQQFTFYDSQQRQIWDRNSSVDHNTLFKHNFPEFQSSLEPSPSKAVNPTIETKSPHQFGEETTLADGNLHCWDPRVMLCNLSFLEQKIHQLQSILQSFVDQEGTQLGRSNERVARQQLVTVDLTSIIIQLISTAGALLPTSRSTLSATPLFAGQLGSMPSSSTCLGKDTRFAQNETVDPGKGDDADCRDWTKKMRACEGEGSYIDKAERHMVTAEGSESFPAEENEMDYEDAAEVENLSRGSFEVLQLEKEEILAPHTHFCSICGKGFKRDANLRMHMRGHGDEYKTPAALAKPSGKESSSEPVIVKRYSCPYLGCKRNKDHKKFQPLKTILCVRNHYKRSHCDKSYTCSRCKCKKFSVIADLKTHEKHCGRDKWLCSCGTNFSRKDKLFGHVALFQGHAPLLSADEMKEPLQSDEGQLKDSAFRIGGKGFVLEPSAASGGLHSLNLKIDDRHGYFTETNLDSCNFGEIHEYSQPGLEIPASSFSFLSSGSCFVPNAGENSKF